MHEANHTRQHNYLVTRQFRKVYACVKLVLISGMTERQALTGNKAPPVDWSSK